MRVFKPNGQWCYPSIGLEGSQMPKGSGCGYELIKKYLKLDVDGVRSILKIGKDADMGLSCLQICKVFEQQKTPIYIRDLDGNSICENVMSHEERGRRNEKNVLVTIATSGHIYEVPYFHRTKLMSRIKADRNVINNNQLIDPVKEEKGEDVLNVVVDKMPTEFADNTRYHVKITNGDLTDEYFKELRAGNIYTSNFNGNYCSKIIIRDGVTVVANKNVDELSGIAEALGIKYMSQSLPCLATIYFQKMCYNTTVLPHSRLNPRTNKIMYGELGTAGANVATYKYSISKSERISGVDFYRAYATMAMRGGFFTMDILSSFDLCDGVISMNYIYYVETTNVELFQGNGIYLPETVKLGMEDGLISEQNVIARARIYYNETIDKLLRDFIESVYKLRDDGLIDDLTAKNIVNFQIGMFASRQGAKISSTHLTDNKTEATYFANLVSEDSKIVTVNASRQGLNIGPDDDELYCVVGKTTCKKLSTDILIRFAIASRSRAETYKMAKKLRAAGAKIARIKTDSVGFVYNKRKVKLPFNHPKISDRTFGCTKYDDTYKDCKGSDIDIWQAPRTKTLSFEQRWDVFQSSDDDDFDVTNLNYKKRAYITGDAGTGKTYILMKASEMFKEQGKRVARIAFTNSATLLINGETCHSSMFLHTSGKDRIKKMLKSHLMEDGVKMINNLVKDTACDSREMMNYLRPHVKKSGLTIFDNLLKEDRSTITSSETDKFFSKYDVILIDEISQLGKSIYETLVHAPEEMRIYAFGDFKQTQPVEPEYTMDGLYCDTTMFGDLFGWNKVVLNKQYRSNIKFVKQCNTLHKNWLSNSEIFLRIKAEMQPGDKLDKEEYEAVQSHRMAFLPSGINMTDEIDTTHTNHIVKTNNMRVYVNNIVMSNQPGCGPKRIIEDDDEFTYLFNGMHVIANKNKHGPKDETKRDKNVCYYHNNQRFIVKHIDDENVLLDNDKIVPRWQFHTEFRPGYATTVHKSQGLTINKPFSIYEIGKQDKYSVYTALTRTSDPSLIHVCSAQKVKNRSSFLDKFILPYEETPIEIKTIEPWDMYVGDKQFYSKKVDALRVATGQEILIAREVQYKNSEAPTRQYTTFDSYKSYYEFMKNIPDEDRVFHECFDVNKKRKLFIDYDKKIDGLLSATGQEWIGDYTMKQIAQVVKEVAIEMYDVHTKVRVYNNTRPGKISFHIIAMDLVGNGDDNVKFAIAFKKALAAINSTILTVNNDEVDLGVLKRSSA